MSTTDAPAGDRRGGPEPAPLVVIVGATGTGKSALALDLAERLAAGGRRAEVVNADAMQLYRGMDIGTAKLAVAERRGVPHHLLDVLEVTDDATVAAYQRDARAAIDDIVSRDAVPILVGGSGLYVSSVVFDFDFPGTHPEARARLEAELAELGPGVLHRRLTALDPDAATAIGPHNGRRLVRALEVIELTGRPFGAGLPDAQRLWRPTVFVGLSADRAELVAALDARVQRMWSDGLVDEVAGLLPRGMSTTASRAIGYAQAAAQLRGDLPQADAIAEAAALTRRYARRQVGWFRRYPQLTWIDWRDEGRVDTVLRLLDAATSG